MKNNQEELIEIVVDYFNQIKLICGDRSVERKLNKFRELRETCLNKSLQIDLLIKVAFDPMIVTHIGTIIPEKGVSVDTFTSLINDLMSVKAINNELRSRVNLYVGSFNQETQPILINILTKSMNIGISIKGINKAVGFNLIRDIEIMKAESDISIVEKWFNNLENVFAEIKYDGIRGFAEIEHGKVQAIRTYNMSEMDISKMTHIIHEIESFGIMSHMFIDFEITSGLRQYVAGEVNKLLKGTAIVGCDRDWTINVFDVVSWDAVINGLDNTPYQIRRELVSYCSDEHIKPAESFKVNSMIELMELYGKVLSEGHEGLMVKVGSGVYEMKRSKNWVKMKAENTCDLEIISWFKGNGKRKDKIGGFTCSSSDGDLIVSVGSGFSDQLLDEISANPDFYIGKIVEIKYNSIISKKDNDIKSLFLPRFKGFRFDKDTANSINEIKK